MRRRWVAIASIIAAGVTAGGAMTAAASAGWVWPNSDVAPLPGAAVSTPLSEAGTLTGSGDGMLNLSDAPDGSTDLSVVFTCGAAGSYGWGTSPEEIAPLRCSAGDTVSNNFALAPDVEELLIQGDADNSWSLAWRFVETKHQPLSTNASGETLGVSDGETTEVPDLVAVVGRTDTGELVDGYSRASDLAQPNPAPTSPEEALRFQEENRKNFPEGREVPVYKSDGATRIGTFTVQTH